uniref:Guanylate kinase n=1 Tax=Candidatus Kentrum sp. SD TaxID=2126332 RepID=A0A451BHH9_9GAMM|nr:MAG: guanylate kinase [Candidatus Kentron sp. SD]
MYRKNKILENQRDYRNLPSCRTWREALICSEFGVSPRYLLALTGPSGVGKTTISQRLVVSVPDYIEKPPIITTRVPSIHDGDEYRHVTTKEFLEIKASGELAAETELPPKAERRWYGYRVDDLDAIWRKGKVPVLITEMHFLRGFMSRYGRGAVLSCGLLPPGGSRRAMLSVLLERLRRRDRDSEESIRGRMENAERDLTFFREYPDLFDCLLVNNDADSIMSILEEYVIRMVSGDF